MRCDVDVDGVGDGDGELEGGTECTKGQGKRRPGRTRDTLVGQSKHRVVPTAYNRQSVLLDDVGLFLEHSLIGIRIELNRLVLVVIASVITSGCCDID
jgi:hypothetical protein